MTRSQTLCTALLLSTCTLAVAAPAVQHDLRVVLDPDAGRFSVVDTVTLPEGVAPRFALHAGLAPHLSAPGARLIPLGGQTGPVPLEVFDVALPKGTRRFTVSYAGPIVHPPGGGDPRTGERQDTPGHIGPEGVYLGPESFWYPAFEAEAERFTLRVEGPSGWRAVSQGERLTGTGAEIGAWREQQPQPGIYLIANRFEQYQQGTPWGEALVYLHRPDAQTAARYLEATDRYVALYGRLIGPYPYAKFALVENFWESGYGMPSFTLLGPRVLRLPFIVDTSYPHEVLHNWWGNSVYVDYAGGNWAEGLTTYLADHLLAELQGQGEGHRRAALQRYADYVAEARDFPLTEFRAHHGALTQAVGYSKSMMLFHMLRLQLSDAGFVTALQRFYADNQFKTAGFPDLQTAFEATSGQSLAPLFAQWTQRVGAPRLAVHSVRSTAAGSGFRLQAVLSQTQAGEAYLLEVPVAVELDGRDRVYETTVTMSDKRQALDLRLPAKPLRLAIDPRFDLFRRLEPGELPASFGQAFGAAHSVFVLPAAAPAALRDAYRELAAGWAGADDRIVSDAELPALPAEATVWLLGWENRFRPQLQQALAGLTGFSDRQAIIEGSAYGGAGQAVALAAHAAGAPPTQALVWVAGESPERVANLARRLPHYARYSYAVFAGETPQDVHRGQWPVTDSPLLVDLSGGQRSGPLRLTPRTPLTAVLPARGLAPSMPDGPGIDGRTTGSSQPAVAGAQPPVSAPPAPAN